MRVTREQAVRTRERILDAAAHLFRERGFDGIGVADLMRAAGLTHGGFYGHFDVRIPYKPHYQPLEACEAREGDRNVCKPSGRDDPRAGRRRSRALQQDS